MRKIAIGAALAVCCLPVRTFTESLTPTTSDEKPTLHVVATAHLDTQWRWTIKETIDEFVPATFRDNFALMDAYPDYVFSFEGAFRYMLLREYYPEEYEKLKAYIANGQWRVAGSWVDAVDVNVPSFESLVRHVLYGNGFYEREFGKRSRDVFLPDCFGFGYTLPSAAAHCGLESFSTQKLSWGSSVPVPFDIGRWEGVDGSTIIAALRPGAYVSRIKSDLSSDSVWMTAVKRQTEASGMPAAYMYFGTGDTGGAPDTGSVDWLHKSMNSDGPLQVVSIGSDDVIDAVAAAENAELPLYKGELLMTRHGVGCYTSQSAMKRWNRKNELLADAAERAGVMADLFGGFEYPRETLRDTWVRFLWHQFHDDLTGTSIPEAYEYSWNDEILCLNRFAGVLEGAIESAAMSLDTRGEGIPVLVYNSLAIERQDVVDATVAYDGGVPEHVRVFGADGQEVASQVIKRYDDRLRLLFLADVPSVGFAVYDVRPSDAPGEIATNLQANDTSVENGRYRITWNENGDVASIFDKANERELLSRPIVLELLYNKPRQWPAWEIEYDDIMAEPQLVVDDDAQIRVLESGPVRAAVEISRAFGQSTIVTTVQLAAGGDRVEFLNDIEWYEKESLLKVAVRPTTHSASVSYDLGLGSTGRGVNKPELYEVPGQQWADMTSESGDYGVAVLNDCRYGWDHPTDSILRLTLIHTPGVFDNWSWVEDQRSQDLGRHEFTYAIQGHAGDWREGEVVWEAARLNQPLLAFQTSSHDGALGKEVSLLQVETVGDGEPTVMISAVKLAEDSDEIVIRARELTGTELGDVQIHFAGPIESARQIDGSEKPLSDVQFDGNTLLASFTAYQPKAFAVRISKPDTDVLHPSYFPVDLTYNVDGISLDADRHDGDFDGIGNSFAGELLPDTVKYKGIPFVTGSKAPGELNVMACEGQSVAIPDGEFDRLYIVAAATGGPAEGVLAIGGHPTTIAFQDYAQPIGRWNSRLVGGEFVEEAGSITPTYILRQPVAWYGSHRHNANGENEAYQFCYLYIAEILVPEEARSVTLPDDPQIKIIAVTAVKSNRNQVIALQPLYDVADATLANVTAERSDFIDSMVVTLNTPMPGASVHYTLDGSEPTAESPVFRDPIILEETTALKARAILAGSDDSFVSNIAFTKLAPRDATTLSDPTPGVRCLYYEGEWANLPDFGSLAIHTDQVIEGVMIPDFAQDEDYGLVITGYVKVPDDGLYDFYINSDDGSALYLGDKLLADNDGVHGPQEIGGGVALAAGLHPFTVLMFQRKGGEFLEFSIKGPGLEKQPVTADMLFYDRGAGGR